MSEDFLTIESAKENKIYVCGQYVAISILVEKAKEIHMRNERPVPVKKVLRELNLNTRKLNGDKNKELANIFFAHNIPARSKPNVLSSTVEEKQIPNTQQMIQYSKPALDEIGDTTMLQKPQVHPITNSVKTEQTNEQDLVSQLKQELANCEQQVRSLRQQLADHLNAQAFVWSIADEDGSLLEDQWDAPAFGPLLFYSKESAKRWVANYSRIRADHSFQVVVYSPRMIPKKD